MDRGRILVVVIGVVLVACSVFSLPFLDLVLQIQWIASGAVGGTLLMVGLAGRRNLRAKVGAIAVLALLVGSRLVSLFDFWLHATRNMEFMLLGYAATYGAQVVFPLCWGCALARLHNPADELAGRLGGLAGALLALLSLAQLGLAALTMGDVLGHGAGMILLNSPIWSLINLWIGVEMVRNTTPGEFALHRAWRAYVLSWGSIACSMLALPSLREHFDSSRLTRYFLSTLAGFLTSAALAVCLADYFQWRRETGEPPPSPRVLAPLKQWVGFWTRIVATGIDICVLSTPIMFFPKPLEQYLPIFLLLFLVYYTALHGGLGATLGKLALGLKVIRKDRNTVGPGLAFARFAALFIPLFGAPIAWWVIGEPAQWAIYTFLPAGAACLSWAIVTALHPEKASPHDQMCGTRVVNTRAGTPLAADNGSA